MKKFLSITLSVILMLSIIPLTVYADDSDNVYCQYTGSTTTSWGYKPNCTFTVNKIVGDKFKGSFVATNLGSYNLSKQVEGTVYKRAWGKEKGYWNRNRKGANCKTEIHSWTIQGIFWKVKGGRFDWPQSA